MNRIRIFVAELRDNPLDPVEIPSGERLANEALKLERAAFPLVVELIVERFCDIGIHVAVSALYMAGSTSGSTVLLVHRARRRSQVAETTEVVEVCEAVAARLVHLSAAK